MEFPRGRFRLHSATGLAGWNAYFLAKFLLVWQDLIGFHPIENLAFATALLIPLKSPAWRRVRSIAAWPAGAALLYYDSWLPPLRRALSQFDLLTNFSLGYLVELAGRFISIPVVAALVLTVAAYLVLSRWLRFSVLVMTALVVLAIHGGTSPASLSPAGAAAQAPNDHDAELQAFFAHEANRSVAMRTPAADAAPFDVIFLQVCSLSWDDLRATGLDGHPLWQRFDMLLTRFNSAAAYSGPAAIRILRATCGQQPHNDLYNPAPPQCYLMDGLRRAGFEPALALNHDGHFDNFLKFVQAQGGMDVAPLLLDGLRAPQHSFDGSPIYADGDVLGRWLDRRARLAAPRVALFYNTVSLHDGNRTADQKATSLDTYRERLQQLLDDIDGFMQALERSGRRAVVVMVPEHGAAVRGDRMQIAGLREIPSPTITLVPVGVKVIGAPARRSGAAARVDEPTSYLAVSEIVARMLTRSPFAGGGFSAADYVDGLPATPFVAQNEGAVVVAKDGRYFLKLGQDNWSPYAVDAP